MNNGMKTIKCKYCGKSYPSPSEMRKRKCRSHPKGAWGGYCTPSSLEESFWKADKFYESQMSQVRELRDSINEQKRREAEFTREYKKHTPLLDCVLGMDLGGDEPSGYKLQIRNSNLYQLALDLANGIIDETRDAINTIYALRAGCDYVLNNADAQKEGSLSTWLDELKQLKDEVLSWDFWVALFYLTMPLKIKAAAEKKKYENDIDNNWKYWLYHSIADVFHTKQVLPMLRVLNKRGDEKDVEVMSTIEAHIKKLKSKLANKKDFGPGLRCVEALCQRINDYSFWGILYCLYWMTLRPTPWDDQKVWPIQVAKTAAKKHETPTKYEAKQSDAKAEAPQESSLKQKDDSGSLKELDALIGLGRVKDEVRKLVELVRFNAARKAKGLSAGGMTSHFVFTGNPGTGKTTVARIIAGIYQQLGILKKGHLIEVDRSKLVAGYVGHTAMQTNAVVDSAMDGVLFIDEAYSLVAGGTSDFGSEAIATLLKRMEDARERIVVIVAGYSDEMSQFVKSNPGLESRFTKFIEFPDYSIDELVSIFDSIAKKNQFTCSPKAHELLRKTIEAVSGDGHVSGNARYVRNLFDAVRERMARRVMKITNATMGQLQTIEAEDFEEFVSDTIQQPLQHSVVIDMKNEPEKAQDMVKFNQSNFLKDLCWRTLGMREVKVNGNCLWDASLPNGCCIYSWQKRFRSNLECYLWVGRKTVNEEAGDHITAPTFHIFHDGKCFQLKIWAEFWGNWPKEKYLGINFNAEAIQSDLVQALDGICTAWSEFGIKGNCGCNPGDHVGSGYIFWNATIPFVNQNELVSEDFSKKLRDGLVKLAESLAILLPYRVLVNNNK